MRVLEVFCSCWFTFEVRNVNSKMVASWRKMLMNVFVFEVVTRLLLAPNRKKFFHHPLNIIDMVSVIPIYITLAFDLTVGSESELGDLGRLVQVGNYPAVVLNLTCGITFCPLLHG